ncbi:uncharacterized protein LOC133733833 [Rosa rugosa]|uniref:uncharacterized protein LOC133733833 n=1 Tax=Rosa rugosa TaxID=74645 RepID=UPI002B4135AB|nr:uncharacterized protein LOC133733833 [Rosa rugosa]
MLPPLSLHSELSLTNKLIVVPAWHGVCNTNKGKPWSYCSSSSNRTSVVVRALKEESQQFEVDPEKAREALRNLDQQFQSRSQKQVRSRPKKEPAPSVNFTRNQTKEAAEEFSGSFFTYTAVALIAFTIFYNVFFYTVIKPSVDGFSEDAPTKNVVSEIPK